MTIKQVLEFNQKFDLPDGSKDLLDADAFMYRFGFLHEELQEFGDAYAEGDQVGMFDALLDLVYVAYGTALFMGISAEQWEQGMDAVQESNISKIRAHSAVESKRGTKLDVVKPKGWVGPEARLQEILEESSE